MRVRGSWKRVLLVLASSGLSLGLLEVAVRTVDRYPQAPNLVTRDRVLGWALRAGMEGWRLDDGSKVFVRINGAGFRDREHTLAKPDGVLRIAVLGDSYSQALGVPVEKAFWAVLERRLTECPALNGRAVEVLNFGASGYGPAQESLTLSRRVFSYAPDLVLLEFFSGNDVTDSVRRLCCGEENTRPYLVASGDRMVVDDSFALTSEFQPARIQLLNIWHDARTWSRALGLVYSRLDQLLTRRTLTELRELERRRRAGDPAADSNSIFSPPRNDAWREAWRVVEGALRAMNDAAVGHRAAFTVALVPGEIQVHPDLSVRRAFMRRLGVDSLDYADRRMVAFGEADAVSVIPLAGPLGAYAESRQTFLNGFDRSGFGHWNEEGHRLAGEVIADRICAAQ